MKHSKKYMIASVLVAFLFACSDKPQPAGVDKEPEMPVDLVLTPEQMKNGNIKTTAVVDADMEQTVVLNGLIDVPPQNMVSITCPLGGYVTQINLLPGQEVSKGDVLIVLEDPLYIQLQQDYLTSKSRLTFLEHEFKRQTELASTDAASKKTLQQVTADYETEKAVQSGLKQKMALIGIHAENVTLTNVSKTIQIKSPIHGFISKVLVNRGRYVSPTEVLTELMDPADIHASLTVFEKDISGIAKGQRVSVNLVSSPEETHMASVLLVSRNVGTDRSGMVHCHFDHYSSRLVPGMAITGKVVLGSRRLPIVPASAVLLYKGRHYVLLASGANSFKLTEIQPGESNHDMVAILSSRGRSDWKDARVVSNGAFLLLGTLLKTDEEGE
jgi:cobalt-zinc-cadmium efflux system membrane fusion protein